MNDVSARRNLIDVNGPRCEWFFGVFQRCREMMFGVIRSDGSFTWMWVCCINSWLDVYVELHLLYVWSGRVGMRSFDSSFLFIKCSIRVYKGFFSSEAMRWVWFCIVFCLNILEIRSFQRWYVEEAHLIPSKRKF